MLRTLPLFVREQRSGAYLITNQLGAYQTLPGYDAASKLIHEDFGDFPESTLDHLKARGFICDEDDFHSRLNFQSSALATRWQRAMRGPALIMIVPTLNCDHDCKYCQVSRAPLNKPGFSLDKKVIPDIIRLIDELPEVDIKVEFQGGEPLLAFPFIRALIEQNASSTKRISYVICSALGPLSPDILDWARSQPVHFSVSLDGHRDLHQSNRPSRHFDSYDRTIEGVTSIQSELGRDRVSCLTTITRQSLARPEALVDEYFDLGLDRIFLRPLSPFGFASRTDPSRSRLGYSVGDFFTFYRAALQRICELNTSRRFVEDQALLHLQRLFHPHRAGYIDLQSPSGFLFGGLVVNYDGRIFGSDEARMLWQSTAVNELVLGQTTDSLAHLCTSQSARRLLSRSFTACTPGCDECAFQPFCGADPMHHLSTQGDDIGDKAKSFFCEFQRAMFDFLIEELEAETLIGTTMKSWLRH